MLGFNEARRRCWLGYCSDRRNLLVSGELLFTWTLVVSLGRLLVGLLSLSTRPLSSKEPRRNGNTRPSTLCLQDIRFIWGQSPRSIQPVPAFGPLGKWSGNLAECMAKGRGWLAVLDGVCPGRHRWALTGGAGDEGRFVWS